MCLCVRERDRHIAAPTQTAESVSELDDGSMPEKVFTSI